MLFLFIIYFSIIVIIKPVTPWYRFTPPNGVVHRYTEGWRVYNSLARCTTRYGRVNHGVTILSPTNHTFFWPKIIFKHVFGQFDVQ